MPQGFRGTTHSQDGRFADKDAKLLRSLKFPSVYSKQVCWFITCGLQVNLSRVNLEAFRPWVASTTRTLLGGVEDDVLVGLVFNLLEQGSVELDPRAIQIQLTGFLESHTPVFMAQLWQLLLQAQESAGGVPSALLPLQPPPALARPAAPPQRASSSSSQQIHRSDRHGHESRAAASRHARRRSRRSSSELRRTGRSRSADRRSGRRRHHSRRRSPSPPPSRRRRGRSPSSSPISSPER